MLVFQFTCVFVDCLIFYTLSLAAIFLSHIQLFNPNLYKDRNNVYQRDKEINECNNPANLLSPFVVRIISKAGRNTFLVIPLIKPFILICQHLILVQIVVEKVVTDTT